MARLPRGVRLALKIAAWIAGVLLVLGIVLFIVVQSQWGRDRIRDEVEARLNERLRGELEIESLKGSVLGSPSAEGLVLRNEAGEVVASVEALEVDYSLPSLLGGGPIHIDSITLRKPDVRLEIGPDGKLALADMWIAQPDTGGPPLELAIGEMHIVDGKVVVVPADGPTHTIDDLDADAANLDVVGDEISVTLQNLSGQWVDKGRSFALSGAVESGAAGVTLTQLAARFGGSSLTAERAHLGPQQEALELVAELDARADDVNAIAPEAAWRADVVGRIEARRSAANEPISLDLDLELAGSPLRIIAELRPEERTAAGTIAVETIDPSQVSARAPPARVSADLRFRLDELDGLRSTGSVRGVVSGRYQGYRLERATLDLKLDQGELSGELFLGTKEDGGLTMKGAANIEQKPFRLDELHVRGHIARLEDMLPPELGVSGELRLDATVSGPLGNLRASGTGSAEDIRFRDARAGRARVTFSLRGLPDQPEGTVSLEARNLVRGDQRLGRLQARAELSRGGRVIDLHAETRRGDYQLALDAQVRREPAATEVQLRRFRLDAPGMRIASTGGTVAIGSGGAVRVDDLRIRAGDGNVRVDGNLDRGLVLRGRELDLGRIWQAAGLGAEGPSGTLSFHAELGGRLDRLLGTVELAADELAIRPGEGALLLSAVLFAGPRIARADLGFTSGDIGRIQLELDAARPRDLLDVGTWRRRGIAALRRLELDLIDVQLSSVYALAERPAPVTGTLDGTIAVTGGGEHARIDVRLRDGGVTGIDGASGLGADITAALDGRELEAEATLLADERGLLTISATGALPGPADAPRTWRQLGEDDLRSATLRVAELRLQDLRAWVPAIGELRGVVDATVEIDPRQRRARATLAAKELRADEGRRPVSAQLEIELADELVATLVARSQDTELTSGRAQLPVSYAALRRRGLAPLRTAAIDARLETGGVPLSLPAELFDLDQAVRTLSGEIEAAVEVTGRVDAPVVDLRANLVDARFDDVRFDELSVRAHATNAGLDASARARQQQGGTFNFATKLDFADLSALDVNLRARQFDLSFLASLDRAGTGPLAGIAGTFDAALELRGTRAEPIPEGWVRLQGGRVRLRGGLQPLSDIRLNARADADRLIAKLEARSGGGRTDIDLEANLGGEPLRRIDGTIRIEDFPYAAGTSVASITGEAELTARRRPELWDVTVGIRDTTVRLPERKTRELHSLAPLEDLSYVEELSAGPTLDEDAVVPEPTARFRIIAPDSIRVRSEEVDATVDADLVVTLTSAGPAVTGTVGVTRGRVVLFDRRYEVVTAQAAFNGELPPNPQLNVQLQHDFGELAVTINVTGTVDEPNLVLSAEPSIYDQATLLAIVLGRNPNGPDAGNKGLEGQALGVASGFLLGKVRGVMEEILPIDVLRVDTGDADEGSRITVGRWVTDDLFVAYRYRAGGDELDNANEAIIEYRLTNRWTLESTYGDRGQGGVDLLWVKRY